MHTHFEVDKIIWNMLLVLFLVGLNGFFVAAEFAFVKVRQTRLQELANAGGVSKARYALGVTKKLDAYLSATQLGITLASLGLGWVGEPAVSGLVIDPILSKLGWGNAAFSHTISFVIGFIAITFLHIILGELAPKSLAIQKAETTAIWLAWPLIAFHKIFYPVITMLNGAANLLLRLVGLGTAGELQVGHTEDEIRILMKQSVQSGYIDKDEMVLVDNIFEFSDRLAREVMLPRIDMDVLYLDVPIEQNMTLVRQTKHTRYPVAVEDKDQIVGFVHITDLLIEETNRSYELKNLVRPILTVPESMEISHVLRLMQKRHSQLAIVIDEYGGTAGLLTVEGILEEIVGEIQDEFDNERPEIETRDGMYSVDGRVLLEELNQVLHLPIEDDEVDTIGGWVFKRLEGVPEKGKRLEFDGYQFEVAEVERLRIQRVLIAKIKKEVIPDALTSPPEKK